MCVHPHTCLCARPSPREHAIISCARVCACRCVHTHKRRCCCVGDVGDDIIDTCICLPTPCGIRALRLDTHMCVCVCARPTFRWHIARPPPLKIWQWGGGGVTECHAHDMHEQCSVASGPITGNGSFKNETPRCERVGRGPAGDGPFYVRGVGHVAGANAGHWSRGTRNTRMWIVNPPFVCVCVCVCGCGCGGVGVWGLGVVP